MGEGERGLGSTQKETLPPTFVVDKTDLTRFVQKRPVTLEDCWYQDVDVKDVDGVWHHCRITIPFLNYILSSFKLLRAWSDRTEFMLPMGAWIEELEEE